MQMCVGEVMMSVSRIWHWALFESVPWLFHIEVFLWWRRWCRIVLYAIVQSCLLKKICGNQRSPPQLPQSAQILNHHSLGKLQNKWWKLNLCFPPCDQLFFPVGNLCWNLWFSDLLELPAFFFLLVYLYTTGMSQLTLWHYLKPNC